MHPELVEGGALSGLDPDQRWVLAGSTWTELMREAGAQFSESPRSGEAARESEREIGKAAAARGDSEKTSTIPVRWERLPS